MEDLWVLNDDIGRFVILRKIRGKLIRRPRDRSQPREIVADGRDRSASSAKLGQVVSVQQMT